METTVARMGRTTIPAAIRKRHGIKSGDRLLWIEDGESIRVVLLPSDPLHALRGAAAGDDLQTQKGSRP